GVLGTYSGVASDMDGEFELQLPRKLANNTIRFSVVGYARYDILVSEATAQEELKVSLQPISFKIDEVQVKGRSLVYIRMLKKAVENISKNYLMRPYNYVGYFEYKVSKNDQTDLAKEAIVTVFDNKGYSRSDVETAFKQVNYNFSEVRRAKAPRSVYDKLTYFDDIVAADIVRNTRNVLDTMNINDFTLTNQGHVLYEGDSVQVIGYTTEKPSSTTSGNANVTQFRGKIYVNLTDFAIIKNEMYISASDYSLMGRNLVNAADSPKKENVEIVISTNYKKMNSFYILSGVSINYSYKEAGEDVKGKMHYITTRVNVDSPQVINGRTYYEEIKNNPGFWNTYTVYLEE
ncbi:carboxypeptidase-like regulatory domain-containing protein, partial [Odoribacter sp. OttesenSCG-928-G04]|nr:carboxypeptidase-like regulatory domain-containing protein [Odoribacter sp. OttesenSCG-928-G04]